MNENKMELDSVDHPGRFFSLLARDLKSLAISNIQFFQNGKQSHHAKFHVSFSLLYEYLDVGIEPSYRELSKHLHLYDFSPEVKGNGYRSLLQIVHKCCLHLLQLSRYICSVKDSMLFRKRYYAKELEAYVSALGQLRAILYYAAKLLHYCQEGELFADEERLDNAVADHFMMEVESLNQECFYGRCLGFQFCESMMRPVQIMNIAMASYSEGYLESSSVMQVATSVFNSGKFFLDPELRATQLAKVSRTADIKFCKAFWSISESGLVQQLPSVVCPSVEVNEFFPLGPDAFELPLVDGEDTVVITPPCAHIGPGHVMVRLLSAQLREGQQTLMKSSKAKSPVMTKPRTPGLVIHIHGGGFIAQSSKSHEMYLRDWARILDIPILSVDYSLAPELPFPRALEDCFYAYAWAVKNCHQLGSLGERIIICGDSAGGNLAISTAMRAASFGIRRPDGVLGVYPVTMVRYLPSPARLLSLMDPILPVGIVSRCLAAYAGINEEHPLASPSTQEFQSKSSLNSIKMQTAETSDNEWVIIGQDQDECDQIGKRMDQSSPPLSSSSLPSSVTASRSVIDSMEDSFNEDVAENSSSAMMEGKTRLYRSDTLESDEVEIFSQLQEAGSCVFVKDERILDGSAKENRSRKEIGLRKDAMATGNDSQGRGVSGKDMLADNLMSIQETAKSVMEGAHSMLTSLSSFIPSRSNATSETNAKPTSSGNEKTQSTDFYVNRSISSDAVDPNSCGRSDDDEGVSLPSTSKSDELSFDSSSSVSGKRGAASSSSSDLYSREVGKEYLPIEERYVEIDDDGEIRQRDESSEISDKEGNTNGAGSSHDPSLTSPLTSSSSVSPQSSPSLFVNDDKMCIAHDFSPLMADGPNRNFESMSLASDDDGDRVQDSSDLATMTKPLVGVSPIVESALPKSYIDVAVESEMSNISSPVPSPFPTTDKETTRSLSPSQQPHSQNSSLHSHHPDHQHHHQHRQHHQDSATSTPSNPHHSTFPASSVPSFSSPSPDHVTPNLLLPATTTPHHNLQEPSHNPSHDLTLPTTTTTTFSNTATSAQNSLESEQFLTPDDHIMEPHNISYSKPHTPLPSPADNNANATGKIPSSSEKTTTTPGNIPHNPNSKTPSSIFHSLPPSTTTTTTTTPKPPSDLNLHPTTNNADIPNHIYHTPQPQRPSSLLPNVTSKVANSDEPAVLSLSPSPNQIFTNTGCGSDLDSTDTDTDSAIFKSSCLEFLGPSPIPTMPNDDSYYASQHVLSEAEIEARLKAGMARSESTPAFSALLSPMSPVDPELKDGVNNQLPFPNGFKMGMSPSDFKRQSFTPNSPINTMRKSLVVRNPYMSPLMAEPELLKGLPPVCIVASHLDPLLDDSVMFAKRIQRLGMPVELHLLDDLPHGFLNFALISQEAKKASQFCAKKLLEMINREPESSSSESSESV